MRPKISKEIRSYLAPSIALATDFCIFKACLYTAFNSVIALEDKILFKKSSFFSKPIAKVKKGRLLVIQKCEGEWCRVKTDDFKGWVDKVNLWGGDY